MSSEPVAYRREIDGLRAVAVLPVILFHAGFEVFSGGFVGVDVFFVISGYLITSIILRERGEGRFSILKFYERRARRILPALFVMVLACVPFALAWMLPWQLKDFGQSALAVALFSSNVLFWRQSGYFAPAAEQQPLLHTWSLGVEEQYYILFPLMVLVLWRFGVRRMGWVIAAAALASLGLSELGWRMQPTANFYLLPTRAWELLAGSLLAVWLTTRSRPTGLTAEAGGALGLGLIVWSILSLDGGTPFPSLWALLPVGGSVLVILCASPATWAGKVLGWGPMVGIGLISYSAYLWHQPLFAFARIRSIAAPSTGLMVVLAALALGLAWITWRYVERPFRNPARVTRGRIFAGALAGSLLMIAAGLTAVLTNGLPARIAPEVLQMAAYATPLKGGPPGCVPVVGGNPDHCVFNPDLGARVAVWGDSHAMVMAPPLAAAFAARGYGLINLSHLGCAPVMGIKRLESWGCSEYKPGALATLLAPDSPQIIILISRWAPILETTPFNNQEGGVEVDKPILYYREGGPYTTPLTKAQIGAQMRATVEQLLAAGKTVVLVSNVPEVGWKVADTLTKEAFFGGGPPRPLSVSYAVFTARNRSTMEALAPLGAPSGLVRVDPSGLYCNTVMAGRCMAELNGRPIYSDDDHLNRIGGDMLAGLIVRSLAERGKLAPAFAAAR